MTEDAAGETIDDAAGASDAENTDPDEPVGGESTGRRVDDSSGGVDEDGGSEESGTQDGQENPAEGATREPPEDESTDGSTLGEDASIAQRVEQYDEKLAGEVRELKHRSKRRESRIAELEGKVAELKDELDEVREEADDLESRLKRKQADFQNYKKRAKKRQQQIRERATEDFVERLTEVRDNLVRALEQDDDADIRPGVESTLETFDRVLSEEGVEPIEPEPGDEIDPQRHEVMMRVESEQPEDTIADVYKPGYTMAGSVIEEAQVTVSEGDPDTQEEATGEAPSEPGDGIESDDGTPESPDENTASGETEEPAGNKAPSEERHTSGETSGESDDGSGSEEDGATDNTASTDSAGEDRRNADAGDADGSSESEDGDSSRWWRS